MKWRMIILYHPAISAMHDDRALVHRNTLDYDYMMLRLLRTDGGGIYEVSDA